MNRERKHTKPCNQRFPRRIGSQGIGGKQRDVWRDEQKQRPPHTTHVQSSTWTRGKTICAGREVKKGGIGQLKKGDLSSTREPIKLNEEEPGEGKGKAGNHPYTHF